MSVIPYKLLKMSSWLRVAFEITKKLSKVAAKWAIAGTVGYEVGNVMQGNSENQIVVYNITTKIPESDNNNEEKVIIASGVFAIIFWIVLVSYGVKLYLRKKLIIAMKSEQTVQYNKNAISGQSQITVENP